MVDKHGFRANLGIIILNSQGNVFWAKRSKQPGWQFPQGGIHLDEHIESALFRELQEETGLTQQQVEIIQSTDDWLYYRLPKHFIRKNNHPICIGQKQKWFLLKLITPDTAININTCQNPEFDDWTWVSYWYPLTYIISFKKSVYQQVLTTFAPDWINLQRNSDLHDIMPSF